MPHVEIISPAVDIVAISVTFNIFAYIAYAYLYGKEFNKIASVDLRLSLVEILLIIANYAGSGAVVNIAGLDISWIWWYIMISIPIEIIFFLLYKWYFRLSWKDMTQSNFTDNSK